MLEGRYAGQVSPVGTSPEIPSPRSRARPMSAQPGWYPDPYGQADLRWWDGQQWTSADSSQSAQPAQNAVADPAQQQGLTPDPAQQQEPAQDPAQIGPVRRRKRGLLIGGVAVAAVAVLAATVAIVAGTGMLRGGAETAAVDNQPKLVDGYLWEPMVRLESDEPFTYPTNVTLESMQEARGQNVMDNSGIVELYFDQDLTTPANYVAIDSSNWREDAEAFIKVTVSPPTSATLELGAPEGTPFDAEYAAEDAGWGQSDTFYLVRYYDADGKELENPTVTPIQSRGEVPDPIEPVFSIGEVPGTAKLSWDANPGATSNTEYLILKTYPGADDLGASVKLVGITKETSWDASDALDKHRTEQNAALVLYSWSGWDHGLEYEGSGSGVAGAAASVKFAVVAVDGNSYSPLKLVNPVSELSMLPYTIELEAQANHFPLQAGDLTDYPTWAPVTTLSGKVRQMSIRMDVGNYREVLYDKGRDAEGNLLVADAVGITYTVTGTGLLGYTASEVPEGETKDSWRVKLDGLMEAFNARAEQEQSKIGSGVMSSDETGVISVAEYLQMTPSTSTPDVEFPVFGSNDLSSYLAANMLAGEKSIDASAFVGAPGIPELAQAAREAQYQNPLLQQSIRTMQTRGDLLFVAYRGDADAMLAQNRETQDLAEGIVAEIITDGMSETERAAAVNQWLIDNVEYDYVAFQNAQGLGTGPGDPMLAWNAQGTLGRGLAVCGGYADSFNLLAREAGLESIYVGGEVPAGPHAWNRVKIDGKWQSIDPTWNDTPGAEQEFFLFEEGAEPDDTRTVSPDFWIPEMYQSEYAAG